MYKYINFIVLVVGLSIIKNSFNIMFVIYLFTMILYIFYCEIIAIFFIAIQICFITHRGQISLSSSCHS